MTASPPLLRIAWRNVRRNVRHSVGSLLAISVGFVAISLFDGYLSWMAIDNANMWADLFMLGDVIVDPKGASDVESATTGKVLMREREREFVDSYLDSRSDEVLARVHVLYAWGVASTGRSSARFIAFGHDIAEGARMRGRYAWNAVAGRPLHLASESSVLLGTGLADLLDCVPAKAGPWRTEDGHPIEAERPLSCRRPRAELVVTTTTGQLNAVEPEIAGIFDGGMKENDAELVQMPLPLAQRLFATDAISYMAVRLRDRGAARAFARDLAEAARAKGIEVAAVPWKEHVIGLDQRRGMGVLNTFRNLMSVVVVLIAGMSVLTTMARAVSERTREIGTLRSIGFLRRHIVLLFALEAALLSTVASAVGLAATVVLTAAANGSGITYNAGILAQPIPLAVRYVPLTWAQAAAFLAAIAALAAIVPARRAAWTRIPDALTHT